MPNQIDWSFVPLLALAVLILAIIVGIVLLVLLFFLMQRAEHKKSKETFSALMEMLMTSISITEVEARGEDSTELRNRYELQKEKYRQLSEKVTKVTKK